MQRFCTWHRRYTEERSSPFQKFRKIIVQLDPFPLSRHTHVSLSTLNREKELLTRGIYRYYVEYFYILISVAINDLSMLGNDSTNKEMSVMKKFINHRHVVVVFFFFFLQCQTVFSWNQAERYFMKNNRVKFTKRDAL